MTLDHALAMGLASALSCDGLSVTFRPRRTVRSRTVTQHNP
ncbi:hypothetical protein ACWCPM_30875 [Streptomyces sp. NPDC002309]